MKFLSYSINHRIFLFPYTDNITFPIQLHLEIISIFASFDPLYDIFTKWFFLIFTSTLWLLPEIWIFSHLDMPQMYPLYHHTKHTTFSCKVFLPPDKSWTDAKVEFPQSYNFFPFSSVCELDICPQFYIMLSPIISYVLFILFLPFYYFLNSSPPRCFSTQQSWIFLPSR